MNRKKRINQVLKKKQKKANAKLHHNNKPKYISKAERAKLAEQEQNHAAETTAQVSEQEANEDQAQP